MLIHQSCNTTFTFPLSTKPKLPLDVFPLCASVKLKAGCVSGRGVFIRMPIYLPASVWGPKDSQMRWFLGHHVLGSRWFLWAEDEFLHISLDVSATELWVEAASAVAVAWSAQWSTQRKLAAVRLTSLCLHHPFSQEHDRSLWALCSLCTNDLATLFLLCTLFFFLESSYYTVEYC